MERFKEFLRNPFVTLACFIMSFISITGFGYQLYTQAQSQRDTFCGLVQPYAVASTQGVQTANSPDQLRRILALRDGFTNADRRLHCTPDPFDNK